MLNSIRQIVILNRLFNVKSNEWSRIVLNWLIRFFYRYGFVISWTILVARFVSQYGIATLPYLFLLVAFFAVFGTLLYSFFLQRFQKDHLIIFNVFLIGIMLFSALEVKSEVLFFGLLILLVAIFLNQMRIAIEAYTEGMFSPLESERTFPIIESADTIASICAGISIFALANVLDSRSFIYILFGAFFIIVPIVVLSDHYGNRIDCIAKDFKRENVNAFFWNFRDILKEKKDFAFLKGLILIVFLHWFLFNLLEFQYTKAVYQNVSDVVLQAGSGFEHAFIHDLGILFVLFNFSALIIQFFLGGRIIAYLGVVGSMILHSIVTFLSFSMLAGSFNFTTAVLAKNNFTITNVLYLNAYHSAYYAFKDQDRAQFREFLEGLIRPLGAIIGTVCLIFFQTFFYDKNLVFVVNVLMFLVAGLLLYITYCQKKKYTQVATNHLISSSEKKLRLNAVDVLAQNGHKDCERVFNKILFDENEPISLRLKCLRAFSELDSDEVLDDLLNCLKSKKAIVREVALDVLMGDKLLRSMEGDLYKGYRLFVELKALYYSEKKSVILTKIILLMSRLSNVSTLEFLLNLLSLKNISNRSVIISALGNYRDQRILTIIEPYLSSTSLDERISAIVAFGKNGRQINRILEMIKIMIGSSDNKQISAGLCLIGELKLKKMRKFCFNYLHSSVLSLKIESNIALAKFGDARVIEEILMIIFSSPAAIVKKVKNMLQNVDVQINKNIDRIVRQIVSQEIENFYEKRNLHDLQSVKKIDLRNLRKLYCLVEEYEEVEMIDNLLKTN